MAKTTAAFPTAQPGPELVFGLVGAVGTDLNTVGEVLQEILSELTYQAHPVKLSQLLLDVPALIKGKHSTEDERYKAFMDAGNKLRRASGRDDALALLAIIKIRNLRRSQTGSAELPAPRRAYILNSLKHHEEAESLRKIYGKAFYLIAAYSPRTTRIDTLAERIANSYHDGSKKKYRSDAEKIVDRDEDEEELPHGQHVRRVFPKADVFIDSANRQTIRKSLGRFLELVFGNPFITPTHDEFCMFMAKAAALRSADLSRQVGAVVATQDADIIGVGCNEVPKALGGQYWEGDQYDFRDFRLGGDPSAIVKREILAETFHLLSKAGWLIDKYKNKDAIALVDLAISSGKRPVLKNSQQMNLIEFGRIVHAEMAAITDAARRGNSVKSAVLYSTTFPCHMCARHIVSSGVSKVIYIEPYPKSKVEDLYKDSIEVDREAVDEHKISFLPFVGLSPTRYQEIFEMPRRKHKNREDKVIKWDRQTASPRLERYVTSYIFIENDINRSFGLYFKNLFKK